MRALRSAEGDANRRPVSIVGKQVAEAQPEGLEYGVGGAAGVTFDDDAPLAAADAQALMCIFMGRAEGLETSTGGFHALEPRQKGVYQHKRNELWMAGGGGTPHANFN
jgi:hypothetical protein